MDDVSSKVCRRCGGSGHYSFNMVDGTVLQQEHDHLIVVAEVDLDYYRIDINHVRNGQRRGWYVSKHTAER